MSIVTEKFFRSVGVGAQYTCFKSIEVGAVNGYDAQVSKLKNVAKIDTTEEATTAPAWGSNEQADQDIIRSAPTLGIETLAYPANILIRMQGGAKTGAFVKRGGMNEGEEFAHGVVYPMKGGHYKYVWYPRCKLVSANHSAQTKDDKGINSQNKTVNIQVMEFDEDGNWEIAYYTELVPDGETPITEAEFFAAPLLAPIEVAP